MVRNWGFWPNISTLFSFSNILYDRSMTHHLAYFMLNFCCDSCGTRCDILQMFKPFIDSWMRNSQYVLWIYQGSLKTKNKNENKQTKKQKTNKQTKNIFQLWLMLPCCVSVYRDFQHDINLEPSLMDLQMTLLNSRVL